MAMTNFFRLPAAIVTFAMISTVPAMAEGVKGAALVSAIGDVTFDRPVCTDMIVADSGPVGRASVSEKNDLHAHLVFAPGVFHIADCPSGAVTFREIDAAAVYSSSAAAGQK